MSCRPFSDARLLASEWDGSQKEALSNELGPGRPAVPG